MVSSNGYDLLMTKLQEMRFQVETKIQDVQPLIDQQMMKSSKGFSYTAYNTLDEVSIKTRPHLRHHCGFIPQISTLQGTSLQLKYFIGNICLCYYPTEKLKLQTSPNYFEDMFSSCLFLTNLRR